MIMQVSGGLVGWKEKMGREKRGNDLENSSVGLRGDKSRTN
jgi:hypothetical protein